MSKFNIRRRFGIGPIAGRSVPTTHTHEGAPGYVRDARSELFLLAVTHLAGEDAFYENGIQRDERFVALVRELAVTDGAWTARLLGWLRSGANLRSIAVLGAAEYVSARLAAGLHGDNRAVVSAVLQRADEPGEFVSYWLGAHSRSLPKPVKRGLADAAVRLYTQRSLLKYDSAARGVRFGDVLELTHPTPASEQQGALFRYAIDRRHNRAGELPASLRMLQSRARLHAVDVTQRRAALADPEILARAGMTWEAMSGWLQGELDAAAWQAAIGTMGYMALLRNLRNFDTAGVPDEVAAQVAARLADPAEVATSRQLPLRFLAAYRAAPSLRWAHALEQALGHSLANVPSLSGRTLVLVDRSGSMFSRMSARSQLTRADAAAMFGTALAVRAEKADLVQFGSTSETVEFRRGESVLRIVERFGDLGGTQTAAALRRYFGGQDRVVILTDEQAWYDPAGTVHNAVPQSVPVYTWNLVGYRAGHGPSGPNRFTFGGLTDAGFGLFELVERGRRGDWPF